MFHHKHYTRWQRLVLFIRDIRSIATCDFTCPGCGSNNTSGDSGSWICHNCGSQGQS